MRCNEVQTMKVRRYIIERLLTAVLATVLLSGCSLIDDDPGKCGYTESYELDYELELVTNMTTEIQTQLSAETDISVAAVLKAHLSDIFTDFAHDVDLSFYDTKGDSIRLHHDEHIMDANQHSYTLYIPRQWLISWTIRWWICSTMNAAIPHESCRLHHACGVVRLSLIRLIRILRVCLLPVS